MSPLRCERYGVKAHFAVSEEVPTALPFDGPFDLICAFSVFTHLSAKKPLARPSIQDADTSPMMLLITIRPKQYWQVHSEAVADRMIAEHDQKGFAFLPSNRPRIDGDVTYGDTSMSIPYLAANFPCW